MTSDKELFDLPLLKAVSDWQRGGDARQNMRRGKALKEACEYLPDNYRTCGLLCFRQVALPKGGVWSLIGENRLPEKISSWTVDIGVAKLFKGGVPPEGQGYQGVILGLPPKPENVIVNIHTLYQCAAFRQALEEKKDEIPWFSQGAGRYGTNQSEIVLEVSSVTQEDIYSLGGHSGPVEQLLAEAAGLIYGRAPTQQEREELLLKVEAEAGPRWLNPEATKRVVEKMKPHAERLGEIKRQQEES